MTDTREALRSAREAAPEPRFGLDDVEARRRRRDARRKAGGTVVGVFLTAAIVAGAVAAVRSTSGGNTAILDGDSRLPTGRAASLVLEPGSYTYQRIRLELSCDGCGNTRLHLESWWTLDDSGRIEVLDTRNVGIDRGRFGPGEFPDEGDLSAFPTDPSSLAAFLLERSSAEGASPRPEVTPAPGTPMEEGQLWLAIRDFLGSEQYLNTTPALRAAMLQVLADLPMVRVEEGATDPLGRRAIGLRFHAYLADLEVFVDPTSGDFLGLVERFDDGGTSTVIVEAAGITETDRSTPQGKLQTVAPPP